MENEWRERLKEAIEKSGQSKRALSQATNFGENYVQQLLKDKKDPSFPRLVKLLSILGAPATLYVILGMKSSEDEAQIRSALIAYGIDRRHLDHAILAIQGFREPSGAPPQSDQSYDRSEPASPLRGSKPSSKKAQQPAS